MIGHVQKRRLGIRVALLLSLAFAGTAIAKRVSTSLGQWLSISGTSLTSAYQTGTSYSLRGTEELDVPISATFSASTALTGLDFQLVVSDDAVTWDPIQSTRMDTGVTQASHTLTAAAGQTVHTRLQTTSHRDAKYVAVQVKTSTGSGAAKAGDAATSSVNYSTH